MANQLHWSEKFTKQSKEISARDIMDFSSDLIRAGEFQFSKYDRYNACSIEVQPDEMYPLMEIVVITFQAWQKDEIGLGTHYRWINRRSKDHSCANRHFKLIEINPILN